MGLQTLKTLLCYETKTITLYCRQICFKNGGRLAHEIDLSEQLIDVFHEHMKFRRSTTTIDDYYIDAVNVGAREVR